MGFQSQAVVEVHGGRPRRVLVDAALVGEQGREEEELQLGQVLADAPPLAQGEDEHVAGQVLVERSVGVEEALRIERLRLAPRGRVVVDGPLVDEDHRVFRDGVAHDGGVHGGGVGDGERHEACEAHHLVDEGHDVGQLLLVLDGRQPGSVHHSVHLLLETRLHLWVPTGEISCS